MTITLVTDERSHQEVAPLLSGVSFYGMLGCYEIFCAPFLAFFLLVV